MWLVLALAVPLFTIGVTGAAGAQTSEVPYQALMATARTHAVVGAFDRASFERAVAAYPGDESGRVMAVRTGNYLLWKIVHLFRSDRTVERIALPAFRQVCLLKKSQYATTVVCRLTASLKVTHRGRTRTVNLVASRNVGRYVAPKPGEDMSVIHSGVAATVDDAVKAVAHHLRQMGAL
jgi:hypothetical protein